MSLINIMENISDTLHIPKDVLLGAMIIKCTGPYELEVENYKSVIEYNSETIKLQGRNNKVIVKGSNMLMEYYDEQSLKVKGRIVSIEYA